VNLFEYLRSAFAGTSTARQLHRQALSLSPSITSGLSELRDLCQGETENDGGSPIFLLSAGWRAGSTLLQRLIMSDPKVLLWGEPYDECGIIQALAQTLKAFRIGWPPKDYYFSGSKPASGDWVANFFPVPAYLQQGHRAFFEKTFAEPAKHAGAERWGIKEVRLNVEHAHYLRWVYPNAKFLFLYRNPLDAYQSYCRYGRNWYDTWPDKPVFTPTAFGRHWRTLAEGFLKGENALGALVVRYEDLIKEDEDLLRSIEQHLKIRMDRSILSNKVGSSVRGGKRAKISDLEKALLRREVAPVAEELGYRW